MPDELKMLWVEREVTWTLQSREEIAVGNAPLFEFLMFQLGVKQASAWISSYLNTIENEIKELGKPGERITQVAKMLQVEGGLRFWPYLARHKSTNYPKDPINAIFWGFGSPAIVADLLSNRVGGWPPTAGAAMWALIDDTDHGGTCDWKPMDAQMRKGSFWGLSTHIRLYGGTHPCSHGKRAYSVAGIHEEQFLSYSPLLSIRGPHAPTSWDGARDTLEQDLTSAPGVAASINRVWLDNPGNLQGVAYDGEALYVEVACPAWLSGVI